MGRFGFSNPYSPFSRLLVELRVHNFVLELDVLPHFVFVDDAIEIRENLGPGGV